ncbi:acyltransferase family protein [Chitiniphilus eburneus]|uniref:acyltransferase family protein n=1 Tax=Chitiniphilus eburneus TaxID=2571148 RepID=UPI0024826396|nr:acyltransferase [Chitiniphilus eburneus]
MTSGSTTLINIESNRDAHLDGLRGLAAVSVAVFHFFRSFDNDFLFLNAPLHKNLLSALWNGHFAVTVFFVLSGLIFMRKFYQGELLDCLRGGLKRYLRLVFPIFILSMATFGLHALGGFYNFEAASRSGSDWLIKWYRYEPDFWLAIKEPLWSAFFSFDAAHTYNANLWTISYELLAVFSVIALGFLCRFIPKLWQFVLIASFMAIGFQTRYFDFFVGAALAFCLIHFRVSLPIWAGAILVAFSLLVVRFNQPSLTHIQIIYLEYPLAAMTLIAAAETCRPLRVLLSQRVLAFFGRISFGIYLTHMLTLCSVASAVFLWTGSLWITFLAYAAVTIPLSVLFWRALDAPWMAFLNAVFRVKKVKPVASLQSA